MRLSSVILRVVLLSVSEIAAHFFDAVFCLPIEFLAEVVCGLRDVGCHVVRAAVRVFVDAFTRVCANRVARNFFPHISIGVMRLIDKGIPFESASRFVAFLQIPSSF